MINEKRRWLAVCLCLTVALCLGACRETSKDAAQEPEPAASQAADASETSRLIVAGYAGEDKEYALADLQGIGLKTQKYSGRNKDKNNERQVREYTGVMLDALLKDAGYEKDLQELTLKIICSDGYSLTIAQEGKVVETFTLQEIKVRAYQKSGGKTIWGPWSKAEQKM